MSFRQTMSFSIVILAVLSAVATISAGPAEQNEAVTGGNEFEDKIVKVFFNYEERTGSYVLKEAEVAKIGGRVIITGIGANRMQENDTSVGVRIGVPWSSVTYYLVMTKKQYDEILHKGKV